MKIFLILLPLITACAAEEIGGNKMLDYTENQEYLFNIIRNRRTVRNFKSQSVPDEHVLKILDMARFAPTAGNQQPWKFLVIRDRGKLDSLKKKALGWFMDFYREEYLSDVEKLEKVRDAVKESLEGVLSAPVYIAVLVDSEARYPEYITHDGTLAAGYLMIAARALGYGTGFFTTYFPGEKMKKYFNIPEKYELICFTPIGIPEEWPETPPKKELEDLVVFDSFD